MITSAERRRPPILVIALSLSLLVHLVGLLLYADFAHKWLLAVQKIERRQPDEIVATSDRITLEKPVSPEASVASKPQPVRPRPRRPAPQAVPEPQQLKVVRVPPQPKPEPTTEPTPVVRREIAHVAKRAQAQPTPSSTAPPTAERKVAYAPPQRQTTPVTRSPRSLSADQIAAYEQQFKQAIVSAQVDAQKARQKKKPPSTMKKYDFQMSGKLADLTSAQGEVTVLKAWRDPARGLNMYYVHIRIVYSDGTSEIVDLPWPVGFPMADDPLASGYGRIFHHMPDPPPGWTLPHPFQLSRLLCIYYHDECKAVIDEEQRNGSSIVAPPVLSN